MNGHLVFRQTRLDRIDLRKCSAVLREAFQRKNKLEGESVANRTTSVASKLLQIIKLFQKALLASLEYQTIDIYWVGTKVCSGLALKFLYFRN